MRRRRNNLSKSAKAVLSPYQLADTVKRVHGCQKMPINDDVCKNFVKNARTDAALPRVEFFLRNDTTPVDEERRPVFDTVPIRNREIPVDHAAPRPQAVRTPSYHRPNTHRVFGRLPPLCT